MNKHDDVLLYYEAVHAIISKLKMKLTSSKDSYFNIIKVALLKMIFKVVRRLELGGFTCPSEEYVNLPPKML